MASKLVSRNIASKFLAGIQPEGAGARVRRAIGTLKVRNFTPFLMMDHLISTGDGFPDHPHRGQETITYVLQGNVDHEDFTGSKGTIGPGDLQFMTAGRGIVHAEMPKKDSLGRNPEMMQIWVDLPKTLRQTEPRYRDLNASEIPIAHPNEKVEVKVISGESYGVKSVQDLAYTPVIFYDYRVQSGGGIVQPIPEDFNVFLYVLNGSMKVNGETVERYNCVLFDKEGASINATVEAADEARFIIVGGKRLDQPIYQHGPFVDSSGWGILKAFWDFENAKNGFERSKGWASKLLTRAQKK